MIDPKRLAERIEASGLNYSQIARAIGVKQPTITRLVNGDQYSTTKLPQLARALGTTPEYLNGESEDPGPGTTGGLHLSPHVAEIAQMFAALSKPRQTMVQALIRDLRALEARP